MFVFCLSAGGSRLRSHHSVYLCAKPTHCHLPACNIYSGSFIIRRSKNTRILWLSSHSAAQSKNSSSEKTKWAENKSDLGVKVRTRLSWIMWFPSWCWSLVHSCGSICRVVFRTFQWLAKRSVTPGECVTSLPVPLTHCTHFHVVPKGWEHLELCSHTQTEEDLLKFLMGSTVTFLILSSLHDNIPNSGKSILSPLYVVSSPFAATCIYNYILFLPELFLHHSVYLQVVYFSQLLLCINWSQSCGGTEFLMWTQTTVSSASFWCLLNCCCMIITAPAAVTTTLLRGQHPCSANQSGDPRDWSQVFALPLGYMCF